MSSATEDKIVELEDKVRNLEKGFKASSKERNKDYINLIYDIISLERMHKTSANKLFFLQMMGGLTLLSMMFM